MFYRKQRNLLEEAEMEEELAVLLGYVLDML
jgi:hypothetical protein